MKYDLTRKSDIEHFIKKASEYLENEKRVEMKVIVKSRSLSQNSYLHVCLSYWAKFLGYPVSDLKAQIYNELPFMVVEIEDLEGKGFVKRTKSSADLDSLETSMLIDYIRYRAMDVSEFYIPTSEEYIKGKVEIDNYIESPI